MDKYQLPQSIINFRRERLTSMVRIAYVSIAIRVFLVIIDLIAFSLFDSSAIFMDAVSLSMDIITSMLFLACTRFAAKPPDKDHPFGHGRAEPLIGMQLGLIMIATGSFMLFQLMKNFRFVESPFLEQKFLWAIPLITACVLEASFRFLKKTAATYSSSILITELGHFRIDALGSLLAFIALVFGSTFPIIGKLSDQFGGAMIAVFMIILGFQAAKNNINQLVDRTPSEKFYQIVRDAALRVSGVKATDKIGLQIYGPHAHVNIDIAVHSQMSVKDSHEIARKVRLSIQKNWPIVQDVIVHVEPDCLSEV